ncbi:hypothetical protein ACLB2K_023321 [Fragaria x ananassa]
MDPQQRPRQENGGDLQRKVLVFLTLVTFKAAIRLGIATITHSKPSSVSMTDDYYLILFFVFKTLIWTVYLLTLYAMVVIVFSLHRTESRWLVLPLLPLHIAFDVHFYSLKPAEYWDSSNLHNVPTISLAFASIIVAFYHKVTRDFIWKLLYV